MKVTIRRDDRIFEAQVTSIGTALAEITYYEVVRPTWKIFRTKFLPFGSKVVSVEDFDTIESAVRFGLCICLEVEAEQECIAKKWKNFEKSIDKEIEM
jgi:hypothetical protein